MFFGFPKNSLTDALFKHARLQNCPDVRRVTIVSTSKDQQRSKLENLNYSNEKSVKGQQSQSKVGQRVVLTCESTNS